MNANRLLTSLLLTGALLTTGCKSKPAVTNADGTITNPNGTITVPANSAIVQPGQLQSDGTYTKNPDGSYTFPANSPVAQQEAAANPAQSTTSTTTATTSQPAAPAPPPPPPPPVTVPAGADVVVRINTSLAASRNDVGDRFTGVLDAPLQSHGQVIFTAGTPISGEVVSSKGKGRFKGAGDLGISVTEIGRHSVETNVYEKNAPGRGKRTAGFVGGGAGLGALIGGLAGHGKGALIGGLIGAGGGTAASAYSGNRDVVIPAESRITFRLTQSFTR